MIASASRNILVASLVALVACLGARSLHAQAATPCTYYVSPNGTDPSLTTAPRPVPGKTVSTAFQSLQVAHDYIFQYDRNLKKRPINVCVESGTYYASDFSQAMQNDYNSTANNPYPDAEYANTSNAVLNIYLSGGPNAEVTFEADPTNNAYVLLVQTGWNGVTFAPHGIYNGNQLTATYVPQYVTVNGFNIQGEGYFINSTSPLTTYALSRTDPNQQGQAFFDGNCIGFNGVAEGMQASNAPYGIPSHITISNNVISACGGGGIGAVETDYLNVTGNSVINCSWWSIYGTSGISLLNSVDSDGVTGITKNTISGNWVTGNNENVPWTSQHIISDGEGIIIDSNLNSAYVVTPPVTAAPYASRTLVANNVVWGNGSSAIEVFESQHVDVEGNSTYANVWQQYPPANFQGRGELSVSYSSDVIVANNVFESVAPSYSGTTTTSYPLCAQDIYNVANGGYLWFENNVYYAGAGYTVNFPNSATTPGGTSLCTGDTTDGLSVSQATLQGTEQWNSDPMYVSHTASGWPPRIDLGVTASPAISNGCTQNNSVCLAPATDVLGQPRDNPGPSYASGAFANPNE